MYKKTRSFAHIKQGWKLVGDRRLYFRSNFEYNYALKLENLKKGGAIKDWLHEPETFWFDGIRRGVTNYKPDFKIINCDGTHCWVETKGFWDAKSITKIKRFRKYFPAEKLICVSQN